MKKRILIGVGVAATLLIALLIVAAIAAPRQGSQRGIAASGHILFGASMNHRALTITHPQTRFSPRLRRIWFTSTLTSGVGTGLTYAISRSVGAAESTIHTQFIAMANPSDTIFADDIAIGALRSGRYHVYLRHGPTVLAQGEFRLTG